MKFEQPGSAHAHEKLDFGDLVALEHAMFRVVRQEAWDRGFGEAKAAKVGRRLAEAGLTSELARLAVEHHLAVEGLNQIWTRLTESPDSLV